MFRCYLLLFTFAISNYGVCCLLNVSLLVQPPVVQKGHNVEFLCQYDLEGAPLYSVKLYRGSHEFYRYSPNENPRHKIFPTLGIHVDLSTAQANSVGLQSVEFNAAGTFSCEVSLDAPTFYTVLSDSSPLMVVELLHMPPQIHSEKFRYELGDRLRANCTSPPAKPPPHLNWFINDEPILEATTMTNPGQGHLHWSGISMDMELLPRHLMTSSSSQSCPTMTSLPQMTVAVGVCSALG